MFLVDWSVEYFLATTFQDWPDVERLLGRVRLGLRLGQDDPQVAPLGLGEALLVLVVVRRDLGLGDLALALGDLVADLVREQRRASRGRGCRPAVMPDFLRNFW